MWRQSCRRFYMAAQPHTCLQKSAISTTFFRWSDSITQGLFIFIWYFLPSSKLTTTLYSCSHLRHLGLSYTMDSVVILCEMLSVACHIRCGQSLSCIRLNGCQLLGCNQKAGWNICAMAKHRRWIHINQSSSLTTPIWVTQKNHKMVHAIWLKYNKLHAQVLQFCSFGTRNSYAVMWFSLPILGLGIHLHIY